MSLKGIHWKNSTWETARIVKISNYTYIKAQFFPLLPVLTCFTICSCKRGSARTVVTSSRERETGSTILTTVNRAWLRHCVKQKAKHMAEDLVKSEAVQITEMFNILKSAFRVLTRPASIQNYWKAQKKAFSHKKSSTPTRLCGRRSIA